MTDFFIYRSCDLTDLGIRQILNRQTDQIDRGIAILEEPGGVPPDAGEGSDNPTLDIVTAEWGDPVAGNGTLPPGTYEYDIVPIDTCTGRTGEPQPLPPLTLTGIAATGSIGPVAGAFITDGDTITLNDGVNPAVTFEFDKDGATGTIIAVAGSELNDDGDTFTLDDGSNPPVTFEFDDDGSVVETPTLRAVNFTGADTAETVRNAIVAAINAAPTLNIVAKPAVGAPLTVVLANTQPGSVGNQPITQGGTEPLTVNGMSGGSVEAAGQIITPAVEGEGDSGTFTQIADGDTFVIDDGVNPPVTFEFDDDASVVETPTLRAVNILTTDDAHDVGDAIVTAINAAPSLLITAAPSVVYGVGEPVTPPAAFAVYLRHSLPGSAYNIPITQTGNAALTIDGMDGGTGGGSTVVESNTLRQILYTGNETLSQIGVLLANAINDAPVLNITATGTTVIELENGTEGTVGNQPITQGANAPFTVEGMDGGSGLGQVAQLRVQFGTPPQDCDGAQLRRDGVLIGSPFPLTDTEGPAYIQIPVNPIGNYDTGGLENFRRLSGADLIGGDVVKYDISGAQHTCTVLQINPVVGGQQIIFSPPLFPTLNVPPGFFDGANRSGFYEAFTTLQSFLEVPGLPASGIPFGGYAPSFAGTDWPGPFMSFKKLPPSTFGLLPFMDDIFPGDIIAYGSKTGLVVYAENNPLAFPNTVTKAPSFGTVLVIPFGILPIPPLPLGQFWIVYRSLQPPTFFNYYTYLDYSATFPDPPGGSPTFTGPNIPDFTYGGTDPLFGISFDTLRGGRSTVAGREGFLYPEGGTRNTDYTPAELPNERNAQNCFRVATYDVGPDPKNSSRTVPNFLGDGQQLLYNGTLVSVQVVNEVQPPQYAGPFGVFPGEYEVQVQTALEPAVTLFPFPEVKAWNPIAPYGPAVTLPSFLSPYLSFPLINPVGQYERLTRLVEQIEQVDVFQYTEDGSDQDRSGDVDGTEAVEAVDELFVQNNYPGGLQGLLDELRGPQDPLASQVFVISNGTLSFINPRIIAVNQLAPLGNGSLINLTTIRSRLEDSCGDLSKLFEVKDQLVDQGVAVLRLESREVQIPAAKCPPGQPDAREVQIFCLGVASNTDPLRDGELARVFFGPQARFSPGTRTKLRKLGLTEDEIDAALILGSESRVLESVEMTQQTLVDIIDLGDLGTTPNVLDVLNDVRIEVINTGTITRPIIREVIRKRGEAGIVRRFPGTDPVVARDPDSRPVDDFILPMHRLSALAFQYNETFDVCDYETALASIDDTALRNQVGAFFAVIENLTNQLLQAGRALSDFFSQAEGFEEALEAIGGIVSGSDGDPTLSCLAGPQGAGTGGIGGTASLNLVNTLLGGLSTQLQQRFGLSQVFGQALAAVMCSILSVVNDAIATFGGSTAESFTARAIGCLPSVEDLQTAGVEFPSFEVQVAFECSLDQLNILLDLINAFVAEANEVIDFANALDSGFVSRAIEARNRSCSADQSISGLLGGLRALIGLG